MLENLKIALTEAIEDEYKARATYHAILNKFGAIRPFINIVESEERHIRALIPLFWKYEIPVPEDNWQGRVEVPATVREACQAGVQAEIENAEMYRRLLDLTQGYSDVQRVFLNLQWASQNNHLRAFQRCAERGNSQCDRGRGEEHRQGRGCRRRRGYARMGLS